MKDSTGKIGRLGEKIAEEYLKNKGYLVLDKNYFFRISGGPKRGEIDIVAKKEDTIVFVEVKALSCGGFGREFKSGISPEEKINFGKRKKLIRSAETWLSAKKIALNSKWQIDVISVRIFPGKKEVSHFENAISYG